jgi:23S rRNA (pseudouridine1915-N3)-methyltransferase
MKFVVCAVGHRMPSWVAAGFEEYARRMPRESPLLLREVRPEPPGAGPGGAGAAERIRRLEAERLRAAVPVGARLVALDERGAGHDTQGFADLLAAWAQEGRDVAFLIGGAEGLDPGLRESAHVMLSLSAMTLPHQLVRVLLAEQLYRATSLLRGHPYHRA